jgi:hypothetical protein
MGLIAERISVGKIRPQSLFFSPTSRGANIMAKITSSLDGDGFCAGRR